MTKKLTDAQFVNALSSSQARLRAYAISMVKSPSDADDLLQNACLALWEKRHEFDSDRDFFPWACGFVRIQILRHIRTKSKAKLLFDEALINTLSAEYIAGHDQYDNRREHLHKCLEKLAAKDRGLLDDRYVKKVMPKEISFLRGWPLPTVYSTLSRIRLQLRRCIESKMAQQASPDVGRLDIS